MWDEITYPFSNFNEAVVEAWDRMSNFIPHFTRQVMNYPSSKLEVPDSKYNKHFKHISFPTARMWWKLIKYHHSYLINQIDENQINVVNFYDTVLY